MQDLLTVAEVAELGGCSERRIRQKINSGEIKATEVLSLRKSKQYMIAVVDLEKPLQDRYYKNKMQEQAPVLLSTPNKKVRKTFEEMTEKEREQVQIWTKILEDWQKARSNFSKKCDADESFISSLKIEYGQYFDVSAATLYRKWKCYLNNDLGGLIENRGGVNKGTSSIDHNVWNCFLYYYLDQRQLSITQCYKKAYEWACEFHPEVVHTFATEMSFRRRLQSDIPKAVVTYGREGEKAMIDRRTPYIMRMYEELCVNEYWIADNHTLDVISKYDDGRNGTHRLYLTAFMDARSGVVVGWNITDSPSSQSTILALRHAIIRFGVPENVYLDNGSEFLTHDIAGRGHRTKKNAIICEQPIFTRLGINMTNAIVRNARAKPIERFFNTFKGQISRVFETFCGGNVLEKPENLKTKLKSGAITTDTEIKALVAQFLDGIHNVGLYGGAVKEDVGKKRIDVFNQNIRTMRVCEETDLNLLLMRSTRPQKIKQNGVYLTIGNERLYYWDENTVWEQEQEVYLRYDPDDLSSVRMYEKDTDKYLRTVEMAKDTMLKFNASNEDVKVGYHKIKNVQKAVKTKYNEYITALAPEQRIDMLDMQIRQANKGMKDFEIIRPTQVEKVIAMDRSELLLVSGSDIVKKIDVNIKKMNYNAERRN